METQQDNDRVNPTPGLLRCIVCILTGIFVVLIGAVMLALGSQLVSLGGSAYYAIAGFLLLLDGVLIAARKRSGLWLYGFIVLCTMIWAFFEVGIDGWKLMPRLFAPAILGIWISLPFVAGHLRNKRGETRHAWLDAIVYLLIAVGVVFLGFRTSRLDYVKTGDYPATTPVASNPYVADGDWRYYGRTMDGDRYSPLNQITPQNASQLQPAWQIRTGDMAKTEDSAKGKEFNFEATPIKVGDNLFFCTPHHHVFSVNATTGQKNWEYDPTTDDSQNIFKTCRGVAYTETPASSACLHRIITTTGGPELIALNADTGQLCPDFGKNGVVSLTDHMGEVPPGFHFITSQPLVVNDRIILGGWIYDNEATGEPSGVVRAYDPVTGNLAWAWDLGNPNQTAAPSGSDSFTRGTPNAWGTYTADPQLGLVYLPLGNATPDYFGGKRRGFDDQYSSAIVALDIETGQERWHFQTVHHDLWDFDLPIGPSLVDLNTPQGVVPALVQTTKRGEFFLLDRRTGQSLTQISEKPVPQNPVPGEYLSPTQPYPDFPSLAPKDVTETDTWGATPIDQLWCRLDFKQRRYDGQFTPPTLGKYLAFPAFDGVTDWYGASIDPARKLLIASSNYMPMAMTYLKREDAEKQGKVAPWAGWGNPLPKLISVSDNPQYGTPYSIIITPWLNPIGVPCMAPPWGHLTAIDISTRKIIWQRLLGTTAGSGPLGTHIAPALPTGIFAMGGNIVTAGGVIFIAATADDEFRAFDERTGKMLWHTHLPAGGNATPSTYMGADGRQYVVISAGGHSALGTTPGDYVIAFAIPKL